MRRIRATAGARSLAAAAAVLAVAVAVPVALAAGSDPVEQLRSKSVALGAAADTAALELYALESRLARARAEAQALAARRDGLERRRAETRRRAALVTRAERASQRQLGDLLRALYAQGAAEPLAVLLDAGSLDEALSGLESLDRAASDAARVVERAASARRRLALLAAELDAQAAELASVAARARATVRELEAAAAERAAYLAQLHARAQLTASRLSAVRAQAERAARRSASLQPPAAGAPGTPPPPAADADTARPEELPAAAPGPRTMRVDAVGYSLPGTTATGLPVGHGVVAVDPSVIPLGTRLHVPGYGDAVAADTGGAVRGALIDLWFPTEAQARAWGRRAVVITLR